MNPCLKSYSSQDNQFGSTSNLINTSEKQEKPFSILWPLCRTFGSTFLYSAVLYLSAEFIRFICPQILRYTTDLKSQLEKLDITYIF